MLTGAAAVAGATALRSQPGHAQAAKQPRFLIVLGANGGASLIDGPLAIRASESANAATLNTFPDAAVTNPGAASGGGAIRAVSFSSSDVGPIPYAISTSQEAFVRKHEKHMMVVTATSTSVNHVIAQRRSVTGNEAWQGRTLQEAVAAEYAANAILPNAHLITGSEFTARGSDVTLPVQAFGELVADPLLFPLGLHGSRGVPGGDRADLVAQARAVRDGKLSRASRFSQVFDNAPALQRWRALRGQQGRVETADLISKLMVVADGDKYPLGKHGLQSSKEAAKVRQRFPEYDKDPLEAQAALAYLMLTQGASVTVTLGPSQNFVYAGNRAYGSGALEPGAVKNLPIAFDYSHTSHRAAQAFMWQRIYGIADGLIDLLSATEYAAGESFWDHTLIYIATDFGRTKNRPNNATDFSSGHDLNNGFVVLSPLVPGGKVLGGVNPDTGLTYGFDLATGAPDRNRTTSEAEVFAGLLGALGVSTAGSGLPDVRAMRKA
jgi:hypothetical protein